jgi:hypothetical protein
MPVEPLGEAPAGMVARCLLRIGGHFSRSFRGFRRARQFSSDVVFLKSRHRKYEVSAMCDFYFHNPLVVLYIIQAGAYGAAAAALRRGNHNALCICYLASAIVHLLLGACQLFQFG